MTLDVFREEKRIPISSVVLSSQRVALSDAIYTVRQKNPSDAVNPLVTDRETLIPSVTRVFSKARDFHVFLQAYQRAATTTQPLVASVAFYRDASKVYETAPLAVVEGLNPKTKAVPLQFTIPLESIPPGRYDCQVSVLDPTGAKATFWRANRDHPVTRRSTKGTKIPRRVRRSTKSTKIHEEYEDPRRVRTSCNICTRCTRERSN